MTESVGRMAGPLEIGQRRRLSRVQIALALAVFAVGSTAIVTTIRQDATNAVMLLGAVLFTGLALCRSTQVQLGDPALRVLGHLWVAKVAISLVLLFAGWIPQLDPTLSMWGYDAQRFYLQAQELIANQWLPQFVSLNYVGILYYYGAIFFAFGRNPVIPALINALVTLLATLYVVKVGYEIKRDRGPRDWTLGLALLLPEILWFDVLTSRETLVAALIVFSLLTVGRFFAHTASISRLRLVVVVSTSVLAIAAVRTSMLLPVVASILLMMLLVRTSTAPRLSKVAIVAAAMGAGLLVVPGMTGVLAGYGFDIGAVLTSVTTGSDNIALSTEVQWSQNSIGMLLIPNGFLQSLLFLPARMILYLVAPLPNILVSLNGLLVGDWSAWQTLLILISSIINLIALPYALASLVCSVKDRKANSAPLIFHVPYWTTFIAIAGGNLIIQERYRVMASLLLWGCAWLGARSCSRSAVRNSALAFYGLLAAGAMFYLSYKTVI